MRRRSRSHNCALPIDFIFFVFLIFIIYLIYYIYFIFVIYLIYRFYISYLLYYLNVVYFIYYLNYYYNRILYKYHCLALLAIVSVDSDILIKTYFTYKQMNSLLVSCWLALSIPIVSLSPVHSYPLPTNRASDNTIRSTWSFKRKRLHASKWYLWIWNHHLWSN